MYSKQQVIVQQAYYIEITACTYFKIDNLHMNFQKLEKSDGTLHLPISKHLVLVYT